MTFRLSLAVLVFSLTFASQASAAGIRRSALTLSAGQGECVPPRSAKSFPASSRSISIWFEAHDVKSGDRVRADWYSPDGNFYTSNQWTELPAASNLCLLASLPVSGYGPAYLPGEWSVKIVWNDATLLSLPFHITPGAASNGLVINSLSRTRIPAGETDLTLYGSGFQPDSQVIVEQLASAAGFRRFAILTPRLKSSGEMEIHLKVPEPAEYQISIQNGARMSPPRALVVGFRGYRLPLTAGERWELTQGNVGRFSHDGNTIYAYDFAPRAGRCVTAMRGGIVYAYDGGLGQTPRVRSFGNYITIDHGDGQYSHYAHLQTGTFVVSTGQKVEAGQALAQIGTSGFSFGVHLHVQVTRAARIASQSVPFLFEDVQSHDPAGPPPGQPVVRPNQMITSTFRSPLCDCGTRAVFSTLANAPVRSVPVAKAFNITRPMGELQWWSDFVKIPASTQQMQVTLAWEGGAYLDLHLMSPSGKHYGWSGIKEGFSGEYAHPQQFVVPRPEPGTWRIAVQARAAALGTPPFEVLLMLRR